MNHLPAQSLYFVIRINSKINGWPMGTSVASSMTLSRPSVSTNNRVATAWIEKSPGYSISAAAKTTSSLVRQGYIWTFWWNPK